MYGRYVDQEEEEIGNFKKASKKRSATTVGNFHKGLKQDSSVGVSGSGTEEYRKTCNISERSTASLVYEVEPSVACSVKALLGSQGSANDCSSPFPSNLDLDEAEDGHFPTRDAQVFELDDWNQEEFLDDSVATKQIVEHCNVKADTSWVEKLAPEPQQFRLLYIPATFTKKHIVAKLETFGTLRSFEFVSLPDPANQKLPNVKQQFVTNPKLAGFKGYLSQQPQGKVDEFKGAVFTFEDEAAETKFSEIKRLRVKGLQIKVLTQTNTKEKPSKTVAARGKKQQPESRRETQDFGGEESVEHEHRPTSKRYCEQRERQTVLQDHMSAERNYGFNFGQTEEQFLFVHI